MKCFKCGVTKDLYKHKWVTIVSKTKVEDIVCGYCAKQLGLDKNKLTKI